MTIRAVNKDDYYDLLKCCSQWCKDQNLPLFSVRRIRNGFRNYQHHISYDGMNIFITDGEGYLFGKKQGHMFCDFQIANILFMFHPNNGLELIRYFEKWGKVDCLMLTCTTPDIKAGKLFSKLGYEHKDSGYVKILPNVEV